MAASKERGILFSGAMVRALLAGTKTQTRRVVDMRRIGFIGGRGMEDDPSCWGYDFDDGNNRWAVLARGLDERHDNGHWSIPCPYGVPGDRLWVRETWRSDAPARVGYKADGWCGARIIDPDSEELRWFSIHHGWLQGFSKLDGRYFGLTAYGDRWRPSLHMPRWASRITLEVTEVRVQRLQDISEEDARAEGVDPYIGAGLGRDYLRPFITLWDSINGDRAPWSANPWVWAVSFKRVQP